MMRAQLSISMIAVCAAGCASAIVRGGPTADIGTLGVSGVESGIGAHVEVVAYSDGRGAGYGFGPALAIAGYESSGDADPITFTTLEARYRLPVGSLTADTRLYLELGSGLGGAWLPSLQRVALPLQVELGVQRRIGTAFITLGLRERFVGLIGAGTPPVDAFNSAQLLLGIGFGGR